MITAATRQIIIDIGGGLSGTIIAVGIVLALALYFGLVYFGQGR